MKKMILSFLLLAVSALGFAQTDMTPTVKTDTTPGVSEWLPTFTSVELDADCDVVLVAVPATQAPRIVYDTKGSTSSRFKFEVRDKVLRVSERIDTRRAVRTQVRIEYNELSAAKVENAAVTFETPLGGTLFDLTLGGTAIVKATLDVKDLKMELTGKSAATLTGKVRYFSLYASTGRCDASECEVMSAQVNAASSSTVSLWVTDRLEAKTSTNAKVSYKGDPTVLRTSAKFMGGDIVHLK